jgi:hypothetical protein
MSFQDELNDEVRRAQDDRMKEEQEDRDFKDTWETIRKGWLLQALKDAEAVLKSAISGSEARRDNGGVVLEARVQQQQRQSLDSLRFSPDYEARVIKCSSSHEADSEPFTLTMFKQKAVEPMIKQFVYSVVRGKKRHGDELLIGRG